MWRSAADGDAGAAARAWAGSGAMSLTGPATGSGLGPPAPLVDRLHHAADVLGARSSSLGRPVDVDPLALLTERAAIAGLTRGGRVSCGGATRLVPTADGWLAVSLARPDDRDLLPAWLEQDPTPGDPWAVITEHARTRPTGALVERGRLLGMALAALPTEPRPAPRPPAPLAPLPHRAERLGDHDVTTSLEGVVVADLSSLWAGPLCGSLLAAAGATVVKVESTSRPDGARRGPRPFFDLLNGAKLSLAVDLADPVGRRTLRDVLSRVDVVIEASRPRALEQMGVDARALVGTGRPRVWSSITGHGRDADHRDLVGFGDDAAVAGGLVSGDAREPYFCADAIADPSAGIVAAAAVLDALATGGRWLLDVALSGVAADLAGPTLPVPAGIEPSEPTSRAPTGTAPALGSDTQRVLAQLAVRP